MSYHVFRRLLCHPDAWGHDWEFFHEDPKWELGMERQCRQCGRIEKQDRGWEGMEWIKVWDPGDEHPDQ
jgi:hypothetical protein